MDDLSLDDLLSGLQAVQEKKSTAKLSERNVVELVNKLKQLGLLGDELLYTTNGKEYITKQQIKVEVEAALAEARGRVPLVDLPSIIGVDLVHCERAAEQLVAEGAGRVFLAQGELFSPLYFDGLAAEVDEGLQEAGVAALGELARRFGLAADLLTSQLEARVGAAIQGRLEGGVIYTQAYLDRIKAQLRGALRGALAPLPMATLIKELGLEGLGSLRALLPTLVEQLVAEGSIAGKLTGGAASWVPALFVRAQQEAVKRFFQQNGYIGYDTVSKYGIPAPRQFLAQHFPEGVALESAFVAPSVVHHVEACVEEALQSGTWCDVMPLLPSILTPSDAAALLTRCAPALAAASGGGELRTLSKTCLVAPAFLEGMRGVLLEEARRAAEEAHQRQKKTGAQLAQQGEAKGKAPITGAKSSAGLAAAESDEDEDWDTGKGKGKKGKGKKGKAAPAKAAGKQPKGGKQQAQQQHEEAGGSMLSVDSLAQRIIDMHPAVDGAGADGELAQELAQELRPAVVAEYERALHAIFTAGAERRRRVREAAGAALDESHSKLQLFSHGAELFSSDDPTLVTLQKHLLRTTAADCMDALLRYLAADLPTEEEGPSSSGSQVAEGGEGGSGSGPLAPAERSAIVKQLGPDVRGPVSTALEKLGGASLEAFESEFSAAAEATGLRLRRLDKKGEKARLGELLRGWEAQLMPGEAEPGTFLLVLVPYLIAKHLGRAVSLPGRALGPAVARLKESLPEEAYAALCDLHAAVVESLKSHGGAAVGEERVEALVQAARLQLLGQGVGAGRGVGPLLQ